MASPEVVSPVESDADESDSRSRTEAGATAADEDPAISVRNLTKTFGSGDDAVTAVDGLDLDVQSGTVVGLLGPNGAGKTTAIKSILGLIVPDEGEVRIGGVDVFEHPRRAYRDVETMLEGARNTYWRLTVRENLDFFARLAGATPGERRAEFDALLERFDLSEKADTPVRELSRGQKQTVSLVSTLAGDADVLFLDEPTLGLDVESSLDLRSELSRLVAEEGLTVVLSSHDMDVIEDLCDRVVVMDDGRVVADDSVDALVDLFRSRAFEVTVEGDVSDRVEGSIREAYAVTAWERTADRTTFEVSLPDGNAIHDLTGRLVEAGCQIEAVDSAAPDFEEVFLSLTSGGASPHGGDDDE
jgi:ABC-2 type transport system ATP-binding protein